MEPFHRGDAALKSEAINLSPCRGNQRKDDRAEEGTMPNELTREDTRVNADRPTETKARETLMPTKKKPYTPPSFRFERVFEVSALSCGKISGTQGSCRFILKTS